MAHHPTVNSLLQANARFYETFEALDFKTLRTLWEHSERIYCCHPGWPPLQGEQDVLDSWKRIIENTASITFNLGHVNATVDGNIGIVTLLESIHTNAGGERHSSTTATTNLFAFNPDDGKWKLFHHHASHILSAEDGAPGVLN